jgi:negative regulator of sigma E activity
MQIHRFFIASDQIDSLDDGIILRFRENVSLISEGDAIIARVRSGQDALLLITKAHDFDWIAQWQPEGVDAMRRAVRLSRVDDNSISVGLA